MHFHASSPKWYGMDGKCKFQLVYHDRHKAGRSQQKFLCIHQLSETLAYYVSLTVATEP